MGIERTAKLYADGIMLCEFGTRYELCAAFMRIEEFYESALPGIQGSVFTHEEYMDLYAEWKGKFSYFEDWSGFNITGKVAIDFWVRFQVLGDFWKKEQWIFDELSRLIPDWRDNPKFFIMGIMVPDEKNTMIHELSHGYWYMDSDYRKLMRSLLSQQTDLASKIKPKLIEWGYAGNVLEDEFVAFLSTSYFAYMKEKFGFTKKDYKRLTPMMEAFTKYDSERKNEG